MKAFTKEVKIALVAIVGVIILFFGMNFLKGINIFSSTNDYFIEFKDISGLSSSSTPLALAIIEGTLRLRCFIRVLSSADDVVRLSVMVSTLCNECAKAGSASKVFTLVSMLSSLGSSFSIAGTIAAALPKAPPFTSPTIVPPGITRSRGLLARRRFTLTLPIISLTISADEPAGMRISLSRATTTRAGFSPE